MRNIAQYPLTDEEILVHLDCLYEEYLASQLVGGMNGMIIQALKQRVVDHPYTPDQITGNVK